ncbi:hypothetical protein [Paenibacillus kobensis]|uniref:hypothetical protein n=1 Tax=Paenibacillus kobensis TaxID=59841 RepID=UPI000FD7B4BD|nr:hypothetical protein [Paenibacillus kobensis]
MINDLDVATKQQVKAQRLKSLQAQYYDMQLTKAAAAAAGKTREAELAQQRMDELELAYNAVAAVEVGT